MNINEFITEFRELLQSIKTLDINIEPTVTIIGDSIDSIRENLQIIENDKAISIHKAGVYIICSNSEVLYIGEGGKGRSKDSGNMGHRVYQHLKFKEWKNEIRQVFYVAICPGEFSRLGEQIGFALHHKKTNRLPKYQKEWR